MEKHPRSQQPGEGCLKLLLRLTDFPPFWQHVLTGRGFGLQGETRHRVTGRGAAWAAPRCHHIQPEENPPQTWLCKVLSTQAPAAPHCSEFFFFLKHPEQHLGTEVFTAQPPPAAGERAGDLFTLQGRCPHVLQLQATHPKPGSWSTVPPSDPHLGISDLHTYDKVSLASSSAAPLLV